MNHYSSYDYLWSEPYLVEGIGKIKCPTLLEIRRITYGVFCCYLNITLAAPNKNEPLPEHEFSAYRFLLEANPQLLLQYIRTFVADSLIRLNEKEASIEVVDRTDDGEIMAGKIDETNFDFFRTAVAEALGLKRANEKPLKFKSERARKLHEKIQKNKTEVQNTDPAFDLDNMILKFCTYNKTGINLLNVGNLTYSQFIQLFNEYVHARQSDYGDAIAANTFSYKDSKDYNPMLWIEKLKKDTC